MKQLYSIALLLSLLIFHSPCYCQDVALPNPENIRLERVANNLRMAAEADSAYLSEIDISASKLSLSEVLRNIAKVSNVNISVKGGENIMVTCNFSRSKITDIVAFLCREYNMDVDVIGNIVSIHPVVIIPAKPKEPDIQYNKDSTLLGYDLNGDKLIDVTKSISLLSGRNIIVPQNLYTRQVSGYVRSMAFDDAVATLAAVNGIEAEKNKGGVWIFNESQQLPQSGMQGGMQGGMPPGMPQTGRNQPVQPMSRANIFSSNQLTVDSTGLITAQIVRGNISDIITDLCVQQNLNYFFVTPFNQQTSIYVKDVDFNTLLSVLLSGTPYTYYKESDIYIFGTNSKESPVSAVEIITLTNRSVNKIEEIIPTAIKSDLQIRQFADLNSLIVSGDRKQVSRVETFIKSIDKKVPLVTIEIIIVDVMKSSIREAGLTAGLNSKRGSAATTGSLSPGVDMNFNSSSVNQLINSFNGFGSINIGKVSPDFYLSLKLLEENGNIELRSTPKLSTLNGHEAELKSGQTLFYKEVLNNIIGTQNPIQSESYTWKSIEANLKIKITPFVSSDNHITMDIEIEQSQFTAIQTKDYAPPGSETRSFKSLIRVQNEEMVLLGGIDQNRKERANSGLPFIARIPIIKWFFGTTKNNRTDEKLNVFIKPTVLD